MSTKINSNYNKEHTVAFRESTYSFDYAFSFSKNPK